MPTVSRWTSPRRPTMETSPVRGAPIHGSGHDVMEAGEATLREPGAVGHHGDVRSLFRYGSGSGSATGVSRAVTALDATEASSSPISAISGWEEAGDGNFSVPRKAPRPPSGWRSRAGSDLLFATMPGFPSTAANYDPTRSVPSTSPSGTSGWSRAVPVSAI